MVSLSGNKKYPLHEKLTRLFFFGWVQTGKSTEAGSLKGQGSMLEELFVDGFDNDQIWEEIHMQNTPFLTYLKTELKTLKSAPDVESKAEEEEDEEEDEQNEMSLDEEDMGLEMEDTDNIFSGEDDEDIEGEEDEDEDEDLDADLDEEEDEEEGLQDEEEDEEEEELDDLDLPVKKKTRRSEVDDDFFNLDEFNAMTEKQEQDEMEGKVPSDDEEIDYFADPDMVESGEEDDDDFGDMEENENEVDAHGMCQKPANRLVAPSVDIFENTCG